MLCPFELRPEVVRAAGLEPATTRLAVEGTPVCASGRLEMSSNGTAAQASFDLAARPRFERGPPGSEPGVVPVPPPRMGLDGETRTPNPRLPTPVR